MKALRPVIAAALCLLTAAGAWSDGAEKPLVEQFEIPTEDGLATLRGQIEFPAGGPGPYPWVIMIPGTGAFDRDVHFAVDMEDMPPFDEKGLIFKDLALGITLRGMAAVRFDKRGITCNMITLTGNSPIEKGEDEKEDIRALTRRYLDECIDGGIRLKVTPETIRSDIVTVYRHAVRNPRLAPRRLVVFAHSEGAIHVPRLLRERKLRATAAVLMGMPPGSPKYTIHWQLVDRLVGMVLRCDSDGDGRVTADELDAGGYGSLKPFFKDRLGKGAKLDRDTLTGFYEARYQERVKKIAGVPDTAPYGKLASMRWRKMWFFDDRDILDDLCKFRGTIILHSGDNDMQTPGKLAFAAVRKREKDFPRVPELVLHEGLGHTLGESPLFGPMKLEARKRLLDDIARAAGLRGKATRDAAQPGGDTRHAGR